MNSSPVTYIAVSVLLVAFVLYRQLRERPVREKNPYLLMGVLALIGIYETWQYIGTKPVNASALLIVVLSLIVGIGFGLLRGRLTHLWRDNGVLVQKGNWVVLVIWIVGLGLHLSSDFWLKNIDANAAQLGSQTALIYAAVTLGAQRFMILQRAETVLEKAVFLANQRTQKRSRK